MPDYEYEQPTSNLRPQITKNQEFRQPKQKSPDEVGAVWIKTSDKGVEYLSIKLEEDGEVRFLKAFLFSGKSHKDDNKPTYILYKSRGKNNNN